MLDSNDSTDELTELTGLKHRVYLPEGGQQPQPAVVMVHGRAGSSRSMWVFSRALQRIKPVVVSPQGPLEDSIGGYSWWFVPHDSKSKSAGVSPSPQATKPEELVDPVVALESFIQALPRAYNVDPNRVYAAGFSQGGGVLASLCLQNPTLLKGIALMSSFIPKTVAAKYQDQEIENLPPFLILHGSEDKIILPERAQQSQAFLDQHGAKTELHIDAVGHKVSSAGIGLLKIWFETLIT